MAPETMYETRVGLLVDFVAKSCGIAMLELLPSIHHREKVLSWVFHSIQGMMSQKCLQKCCSKKTLHRGS